MVPELLAHDAYAQFTSTPKYRVDTRNVCSYWLKVGLWVWRMKVNAFLIIRTGHWIIHRPRKQRWREYCAVCTASCFLRVRTSKQPALSTLLCFLPPYIAYNFTDHPTRKSNGSVANNFFLAAKTGEINIFGHNSCATPSFSLHRIVLHEFIQQYKIMEMRLMRKKVLLRNRIVFSELRNR